MNKNKILLLKLIEKGEVTTQESLRGIAKLIGCEDRPQIVKFHISSLLIAGFIKVKSSGKYVLTQDGKNIVDLIRKNMALFKKIERLYSHRGGRW